MAKRRWAGGAIVCIALFAAAALVMCLRARSPEPGRKAALEVTLTAHQFWWEIQYPQLGIVTANEMHVPVGEDGKAIPVRLTLSSADVDYGLRMPALNVSAAITPNAAQFTWLEPRHTGAYSGECARDCAGPKGEMRLRINADSVVEFRAWAARERQPAGADSPTTEGRTIFEHTACISCHAVAGTIASGRFGPDLTHLSARSTIAAGLLSNTSQNLRAFIDNPTQVKPGCLMPSMHLNPHDLDAVTAYLFSLK